MQLKTKRKCLIGCSAIVVIILAVCLVLPGLIRNHLLGPEGKNFDSAGARIYYTDEGQGTPVLLVHGFANCANIKWRRIGLIKALATNYRVIALDNRGHGRSDKPHDPKQYGIQMVEDLVRLLDHLKIEKAHIIGYSMGGFITLKMVAMHPERILSAAACGAGWERLTQETMDFSEAVAKAIEKGEAGPLQKRLGFGEEPLKWWQRLGVKMSLKWFNDHLALAALLRGTHELCLTEEELTSNKVPTLTIIGSKDGLLPDAKELAGKMANHELVVLEGKNHMNTAGSPAFLKKLTAFLKEHTP
jgi:pimeloyl-ACP methyl ester carboxylesterase